MNGISFITGICFIKGTGFIKGNRFIKWIGLAVTLFFLSVSPVKLSAGEPNRGDSQVKVERIISLNPSLTEILFDLNLGDRIVGVSEFSDFPERAKLIPRVGSYARPNLEKIISLKPTVVLTYREGIDLVSKTLAKANIELLVFESRSLSDYENILERLGSRFQRLDLVETRLAQWKSSWAEIAKTAEVAKQNTRDNLKTILLEIDHDPLFVAGGDTFVSQIAARCGFSNIFNKEKGYFRPSLEVVAQRKPDWVIGFPPFSTNKAIKEIAREWKERAQTNFYFFKDPSISRLGPRLPSLAAALCKISESESSDPKPAEKVDSMTGSGH